MTAESSADSDAIRRPQILAATVQHQKREPSIESLTRKCRTSIAAKVPNRPECIYFREKQSVCYTIGRMNWKDTDLLPYAYAIGAGLGVALLVSTIGMWFA